MANSVDPDQTAPSGAVWSGSALFAYVILSETLVFEFLGHLPYMMNKASDKVNKQTLYTLHTDYTYIHTYKHVQEYRLI